MQDALAKVYIVLIGLTTWPRLFNFWLVNNKQYL